MLHRLALRVLPSLTLAVTEDSVRKRKRLVMFVPGLVAFAAYRLAKQEFSLAEPMTLLMLSGVISMVTALCAYRVGRGLAFDRLIGADGVRRIGWVLAWIGFVYGIQLSLLVLALLWLVGYDYAKHPDGPATAGSDIEKAKPAHSRPTNSSISMMIRDRTPVIMTTLPDCSFQRRPRSPSVLTRTPSRETCRVYPSRTGNVARHLAPRPPDDFQCLVDARDSIRREP